MLWQQVLLLVTLNAHHAISLQIKCDSLRFDKDTERSGMPELCTTKSKTCGMLAPLRRVVKPRPLLQAAGARMSLAAEEVAISLKMDDLQQASAKKKVGLRPRKPYRAWCWHAHPILTARPDIYVGVNLDLLPGGGGNTTVAQLENIHGMAALHYATGADGPMVQLKTNATCPPYDQERNLCPTNNTAAVADYEASIVPGPRPLPGETDGNASFFFGGTVINEWNPDPCVPTTEFAQKYGPSGPTNDSSHNWTIPGPFIRPGQSQWCNNTPAAVAGYIKAKMKHPDTFTAAWVAQQDAHFQSLMLSEVFDLAIVEHWMYEGDVQGALTTKQDIINRLEYAKAAGYIDRTIVLYAQMCPRGPEYPNGLTVDEVCALISELQARYPEMPGLNFYGCGLGGANGSMVATYESLIKGVNQCALKLYPDKYRGLKLDDNDVSRYAYLQSMPSQAHSVPTNKWWGPVDTKVGMRPRKPYRAWCWQAHHILTDHPDLYVGTNLDLLSGGGGNTTVAQIENARGMATLKYATGPQAPWDPHLPDGGVNNSGATEYYMRSMLPGPVALPNETAENASFYFGGAIVNEWNPTPCMPTRFEKWWMPGVPENGGQGTWCNNSAAAVAGYTAARLKSPNTFNAAWVTSNDVMFQSMMLSGVLDLAVMEFWICQSDRSCDFNVTRDTAAALSQAEFARRAGYLENSIIMYSQMCPKGAKWPRGFTVQGVCAMMTAVKEHYPEMPGVAFYGCGGAGTTALDRDKQALIRGVSMCALKLYPDDEWSEAF